MGTGAVNMHSFLRAWHISIVLVCTKPVQVFGLGDSTRASELMPAVTGSQAPTLEITHSSCTRSLIFASSYTGIPGMPHHD
jgi:hypothetical protein